MIRSNLLVSVVAVAALGIAAPSFAQTTATSTVNGASGANSDTTVRNNNETLTFAPVKTSTRTSTKTLTETQTSTKTSTWTDNSQRNGNIRMVADQSLDASVSNRGSLNFNGGGANYSSGFNSISGAAFAAYSGILNQGWNTGINSNAQAATNIAAQGTMTFTR